MLSYTIITKVRVIITLSLFLEMTQIYMRQSVTKRGCACRNAFKLI